MNTDEIYECLQGIAAEPSKNAKIEMLEFYLQDDEFEKVIVYAYNPFITFGIRKVPSVSHKVGLLKSFDYDTWGLLDLLSQRYVTGKLAIETLLATMGKLYNGSEAVLRGILEKDLRAGFDAKTINKAVPGLIPVAAYMRCSLPKHVKMDEFHFPAFSQEKADGLFVNITIEGSAITMLSRKYQEMPFDSYRELLIQAEGLGVIKEGYQTHGELIVEVNGVPLERKTSNGVLRRVNLGGEFKNGEYPVFYYWDIVPITSIRKNIDHTLYIDRYQSINNYDRKYVKAIPSKLVTTLQEAEDHFVELAKQGKEGTVLKSYRAVWKNGVSKEIVKFKKELHCELRVIDFNPGTGENADTFGSLKCSTEDGQLIVNVGNLTNELTWEIHQNYDGWMYAIIEVTYSSVITNEKGEYSLFEPKFVERRYDKDTADTLETLKELV